MADDATDDTTGAASSDPTPDAAPAAPPVDPTPAAVPPPLPAPPVDEVSAKLAELGVASDEIVKIKEGLGIETLGDLSLVTEVDLVGAGMKAIPARRLVAEFRPDVSLDTGAGEAYKGLLPTVPDTDSYLESLKTGGVLKVTPTTYISAIRAALADRVGLYDIPAKLVKAMEAFADSVDDPIDAEVFYPLQEQLTRRNYADIFAAIPGMNGRQVTEARKKQLFERIDMHLWPAVLGFYNQLDGWVQRWNQSGNNPGMLAAMLMSASTPGAALPPGMMAAPDTSGLRDAAEELVNSINKVFAGVGVQIASAVAYDASQITKSLGDNRLPAMIGAANRDQMLKQLGVAVGPMDPRLEVNLTQFVLAAVQATKQPAGADGVNYFSALWQLGTEIPWDDLAGGGRKLTGIGGRARDL